MKTLTKRPSLPALIATLSLLLPTAAAAAKNAPTPDERTAARPDAARTAEPLAPAAGPARSPAERRIARALQAIERNPDRAALHNELAMAWARRARETSDPADYGRADEALAESERLAPGNLGAEKVRVWVLLGRHEFSEALRRASALALRAPNDLQVQGFLADANVELGRYEEAERAAQWMLDLRPGNVPGLTRGAYLRELFGDVEGSIDFMMQAYDRTPPQESEERAWLLTQTGRLLHASGRIEEAGEAIEAALEAFPGYHYALSALAGVRMSEGRFDEAASLLARHVDTAPHPENRFYLAAALERAGRQDEARTAFAHFEREARAEMHGNDNANRELIFYYTDHANRPGEAVKIAEREIARRGDVFSREAWAWALHAAGRHGEALEQIEEALAIGVRDAGMLYRAGAISLAADDDAKAERYLRASLRANPSSGQAASARRLLEERF